ncbi:DUF3040 domain-containing protein [Actinoplanes regularis]|uniref:DUF3040 domain-containing protein n=1 Tax=Actinoplanes regularis TaxID=52697 RepID=A0A239ILA9_9ACTN|nr:DUF3040 domain-containing protein [Actinoplanes regularis]GIE91419.1 hypothetical protein Are01nite_78990 [Actinoplanes regularis]GLW35845.1 hypothetical protein Areg01_87800 [Actinoplanes regularis]SNS94329.1 Protein of unknown function [Actinoplanes regularis]
MLEEKDRRELAEIEQRLCAADPDFARRMSSTSMPCPFPTVSVLCVGAFLALPFVGLFLGPVAALVALNGTVALVAGILVNRRRRGH